LSLDKIIHLFAHSFLQQVCIFCAYWVPGTVLSPGDLALSGENMQISLMNLSFVKGKVVIEQITK
jgi:hypothetical protein